MPNRIGKKSVRSCCFAGLAILAGHGIAAAQEAIPQSGPGTSSAPLGYPPCDRAPTVGDVQGAKGAFQAGEAAYREADYERAITYWEDAFRRDCTATRLLLNLAYAYELSLQYQEAIGALKTFNEREPNHASRAGNERRIERLEELLKSQAAPVAAAAPPPEPEAAPKPEPKPEPAKPAPTRKDEPSSETERDKTALYVAIAGGGVAVLSSLLYLKQRHDVDGFEDTCGPERKCPDDATTKKAEDARKGALFFGWTTALGAAVGAAGLVWYWVDVPSATESAQSHPHERAVRLTPALLPNFAGLSVDGHFEL